MPAPPEPMELDRPIRSLADVRALSEVDRRLLSSWLTMDLRPTNMPQGVRIRRAVILFAATLAAVLLIPWTRHLARTLPANFTAHQWVVAWTGFNGALITVFAATAYFGWKSRQAVLPCLTVGATLLICDAWFDVTLSWGSNEQSLAILTALLIEIPFALLLLVTVYRMIRGTVAYVWRLEGREPPAPPVRLAPTLATPVLIAYPDATVGGDDG